MKEIKAFIHRARASDVVHALIRAGFKHLSVVDVLGTMEALQDSEKEFSIELGEQVISEVKVEVACDADRVEEALEIIRGSARTDRTVSGCIIVTNVEAMHMIEGGLSG